jgi:hypothetical protein
VDAGAEAGQLVLQAARDDREAEGQEVRQELMEAEALGAALAVAAMSGLGFLLVLALSVRLGVWGHTAPPQQA